MLVHDTNEFYRREDIDIGLEVTLSHQVSSNPKITSFNLPYGAIITDVLLSRGINGEKFLEIGGGHGDVTVDAIIRYGEITGRDLQVMMLEYNPAHLARQKAALEVYPYTRHIQGDAHNLRGYVNDDSVDIVICNEMIGDLRTVDEVPHELIKSGNYWMDEAQRIVSAAGIDIDPNARRLAFNVGAMMLIEYLSKVLKPGGIAFISENSCEVYIPKGGYFPGNPDLGEVGDLSGLQPHEQQRVMGRLAYPERIKIGDHYEYSVKFSHLAMVADSLGFEVERGNLLDLIKIKKGTKVIPSQLIESVEKENEISDAMWAKHGNSMLGRMETDPELFFEVFGVEEIVQPQVLNAFYRSMRMQWASEYLILKKPAA